jgi:hypothetical protein
MDEMPSAEFRKVYAKLRAPTLVTVNGHRIGLWTPTTTREEFRAVLRGEGPVGQEIAIPMDLDPTFNSRPFTPVPKRATGRTGL